MSQLALKGPHLRDPGPRQQPAQPPSDLAAALSAAVAREDPDGQRRIFAVTLAGQPFWVKRAERLSRRWQLQKGDPVRAFAGERAALAWLAGRGLPVAALAADGADFIALPDCGTPLSALPGPPGAPERLRAFAAGGAALAALHAAGIAHGRPNIRDICWSGAAATLIDLERCDPGRNGPDRLRDDLLFLVHSAVTALGPQAPEVAALCAGYRRAAPPGPWRDAARRARRLARLAPLWRLLAARFETRRGDFAAVLPTLRLLQSPPAGDPALSQP